MKRGAVPVAATCGLILSLVCAAARADLAYERDARANVIAEALAALAETDDTRLSAAYDHIDRLERSQCRAPLHSLEVVCLLASAERRCAELERNERARCDLVSDVIISVRLGERALLPRSERIAILRDPDHGNVLERELARRHAALVIEMSTTTLPSPDPGGDELAAAIDGYCREVAGTRDLTWQHCASAIVWFISTAGRLD